MINGHHIWCNRDLRKPASDCDMCKRFYRLYPMDGLTPDELALKHFPNVIIRPGTTSPNN